MKCFAQRSKTRSSWIFSPVRLKSTSCVCTRNFEPKGWLQSSLGGKTIWNLSHHLGSSQWGLLVWPPFTSLGHIKSWIADNLFASYSFQQGDYKKSQPEGHIPGEETSIQIWLPTLRTLSHWQLTDHLCVILGCVHCWCGFAQACGHL